MKVLFSTGLVFCLLFLLSCEENTASSGSEISSGNRNLRGRVELSSNTNPEDVYVWLEGFDIGARVDASGFFKLTLPPPELQSGSTITGTFTLFYFLGNFRLASTTVLIRNGEFVSSGELNQRGELTQAKLLLQTLRITTEVRPSFVSLGEITVTAGKSDFLLRVDVALQSVSDTVEVLFPALVGSTFGPLFFRNIDTGDVTILGSTIAGLVESDLHEIGIEQKIRTMILSLFPGDLGPGVYEIIPYLFVANSDIPQRLIESLGVIVDEFGTDYVRIPFQRDGKQRFFRVTP